MTDNRQGGIFARAGKLFPVFLVLVVFAGPEVRAQQTGPQELVQNLSDQLVVLVDSHRDTYGDNPDQFHQELQGLMEPVVAFTWIAKKVMGRTYYDQASPEQFKRFDKVFREGLVRTYAKGFFTYNGEEIVIQSPQGDPATDKTVTIVQEIRNEVGIKIAYTLGKSRSGEWKLMNLVVNGINLGQVLRNQFHQAMESKSDMDQVINEWAPSEGSEEINAMLDQETEV